MTTFHDDMDAILFLEKQGYKLTRKFCWLPPVKGHEPTDDENAALSYLFNEWDYGGVIGIDIKAEYINEPAPKTAPGEQHPSHREAGSGPSGRERLLRVQADASQAPAGDYESGAAQFSDAASSTIPKVG